MVEQRLHHQRNAAGLEQVLGDIAPAGLQVGDVGRALEDFGDVEQVEVDSALVRDGRQMQRRVGGAAGGRHHRRGVFERLASDDVARADLPRDQFHDHLARRGAEAVAQIIRGRRAGGVRQGEADRLRHRRHRVGGELRAAGARRRAGDLLQLFQVLVGHRADRVFSDRLEHVLDGDGLALEGAGQDRAAVDEDRRHVEAAHGHHHAGQGLVAARQADERVVGVTAHRQLDRVGDHLARRQRRLHALVAHGDAVRHRDGAEFARGAPRRRDAFLDGLSLPHQRDVARRGLVPAGRDADERLVDLLRGQPHGVVVGAVRSALGPLRHMAAGKFRLVDQTRIHDFFIRFSGMARRGSARNRRDRQHARLTRREPPRSVAGL